MSNPLKSRIRLLAPVAVLVLASLVSGCAVGTTQLIVTRDSLGSIEDKREGTILVRQFVDERGPERKGEFIGDMRGAFGQVGRRYAYAYGKPGQLESLLTEYLADALGEAGYDVIVEKSSSPDESGAMKPDAIMEGKIKDFWLEVGFANSRHKVGLLLTLREPETEEVVWEKLIDCRETNLLWVGIPPEFEKVIRQALTKALNEAASEFSSDDFYGHLESRRVQ